MKVVIVTDGPYGDRTYDIVRKEFDCEFLELEQPDSMFMDDIEIPSGAMKKLVKADLIISYILHPDLVIELVEKLHNLVGWIIVGAWRGEGFKSQLEQYENVNCPENMCDLEENGDSIFDEFVSKFGKPIVEIECEGNSVTEVRVLKILSMWIYFFRSR